MLKDSTRNQDFAEYFLIYRVSIFLYSAKKLFFFAEYFFEPKPNLDICDSVVQWQSELYVRGGHKFESHWPHIWEVYKIMRASLDYFFYYFYCFFIFILPSVFCRTLGKAFYRAFLPSATLSKCFAKYILGFVQCLGH